MGRLKKFTDEQLWDMTQMLLLDVGYQAFTMSLLAEKLGVSRAALYKKYQNKEELLVQFMLIKMEESVQLLTTIEENLSFHEQLDVLLRKLNKMKDLHSILGIAEKIDDVNDCVVAKKEKLASMHGDLIIPLQRVIALGKEEGVIHPDKNDFLILSFIFQVVDIPNYAQLEEEQFIQAIKDLLLNGMTQ